MNQLIFAWSIYNDPIIPTKIVYTHAQTMAAQFFSGCYASQLHGVRPRRLAVCRPVLRGFLREIEVL
jgi:hypothetical protein